MLDEIYAGRKPVHFDQLDVSSVVVRHIPLGTPRPEVVAFFNGVATASIVDDPAVPLVVRDDKGRAMLDRDARSVLMTFTFDDEGKLAQVKALHMKNQ